MTVTLWCGGQQHLLWHHSKTCCPPDSQFLATGFVFFRAGSIHPAWIANQTAAHLQQTAAANSFTFVAWNILFWRDCLMYNIALNILPDYFIFLQLFTVVYLWSHSIFIVLHISDNSALRNILETLETCILSKDKSRMAFTRNHKVFLSSDSTVQMQCPFQEHRAFTLFCLCRVVITSAACKEKHK